MEELKEIISDIIETSIDTGLSNYIVYLIDQNKFSRKKLTNDCLRMMMQSTYLVKSYKVSEKDICPEGWDKSLWDKFRAKWATLEEGHLLIAIVESSNDNNQVIGETFNLLCIKREGN